MGDRSSHTLHDCALYAKRDVRDDGEEVALAFDPADLHLFDPATGNSLTYEP